MILRWHEQAKAEAYSAAAFYHKIQPDLARRFITDIEDALRRIERLPKAFPCLEGDIRKCRIRHFPFGLIYRVRDEAIEVIAVMHIRRAPGYWKSRAAPRA